MITAADIKRIALESGAEKCGIASAESFSEAPEGFKPADIYKGCKSVLVFIKSMPGEIITSGNPIPYSAAAELIYKELDNLGLQISRKLLSNGVKSVPVPCDTPYLFWNEEEKKGMGILSMRHSAYLAGLGILGRNTLLINRELGNMVYIGALLMNTAFEPDPVVADFACPEECSLCLDECPQNALDGITVNQKLCREISIINAGRGFEIYACNSCRQVCPLKNGIDKSV